MRGNERTDHVCDWLFVCRPEQKMRTAWIIQSVQYLCHCFCSPGSLPLINREKHWEKHLLPAVSVDFLTYNRDHFVHHSPHQRLKDKSPRCDRIDEPTA